MTIKQIQAQLLDTSHPTRVGQLTHWTDIRWINIDKAYDTLQKEADQWIEGCVQQFLKEHPECESLTFRRDQT